MKDEIKRNYSTYIILLSLNSTWEKIYNDYIPKMTVKNLFANKNIT